jgi:hypothetical protein
LGLLQQGAEGRRVSRMGGGNGRAGQGRNQRIPQQARV